MTCTYTGAVIDFVDYGFKAVGDLHQVSEDAVIVRLPKSLYDFKDGDVGTPTHKLTVNPKAFMDPNRQVFVVPIDQVEGDLRR